jgi:hypothetical protein
VHENVQVFAIFLTLDRHAEGEFLPKCYVLLKSYYLIQHFDLQDGEFCTSLLVFALIVCNSCSVDKLFYELNVEDLSMYIISSIYFYYSLQSVHGYKNLDTKLRKFAYCVSTLRTTIHD